MGVAAVSSFGSVPFLSSSLNPSSDEIAGVVLSLPFSLARWRGRCRRKGCVYVADFPRRLSISLWINSLLGGGLLVLLLQLLLVLLLLLDVVGVGSVGVAAEDLGEEDAGLGVTDDPVEVVDLDGVLPDPWALLLEVSQDGIGVRLSYMQCMYTSLSLL